MPKKYIFYLVGLLLLAVAGIYGYTKWSEAREKVNLWTLVPDDAVFVVQSTNHAKLIDQLRKMDIWDNIASLRSVETLTDNISLLDSMSGRNAGTSRFLKRKTVLSSVHVTGKKDFDFVFYIPVNTVGEHRFVRTLVENISKHKAFSSQTQIYQDHQITRIRNQRTGDTFFYITFHNNLVVSANGELIREIVRKINRGQLESPAAEYKNTNYLSQPEVYAQLFINYRHVPQFLGVFLQDNLMPDITFLASLCRTSMLGLKQQKGELVINGFSNPEPLSDSFFNLIKTQAPQRFELRHLLPLRTALVLHLGLNQVGSARHRYPDDRQLSWPANQQALADSLVQTYRQELGIAYLEANDNKRDAEKVLFAHTLQPGRSMYFLNALIQAAGNAGRLERYGPYAIRQIPIPNFPVLLFGSLAQGFTQCYITQVGKVTLFAADAATLRSVLADIRAGRVWSESDPEKAFLEHTQQESNFSLYFNTRLAWPMISRHVREQQRNSLLRHEALIKKFGRVALQFRQKDNQYFTSFLLTLPPVRATSAVPEEAFELQTKMKLPATLLATPWYIQTGTGSELLVQDEDFVLRRLMANGEAAWTDTLGQEIKGEVYPVIFGGEKQTKYLFAAGNHVHCVDQNGRDVENFPFNLPDTVQVAQLVPLNFNHSQEPRLLVSDQSGNLFLFDTEGNLEEGWGPKEMGAPLAGEPRHYRVNGRDLILLQLNNGNIFAFNVRGELYPGFPINAGVSANGVIFGQAGTSLRQTQLTFVTGKGQQIKFNLTGQVLQRRTLPSGRRSGTFELVPDPAGKSFIITRQEPGKVSLFDQDLKLLLEKNFITSSRKICQYYDFGPLNRIYVLTETGPRKTYLYNYQAKLVGGRPVDNKLPVIIRFNEQSQLYTLFTAFGKEINRLVFRDK